MDIFFDAPIELNSLGSASSDKKTAPAGVGGWLLLLLVGRFPS